MLAACGVPPAAISSCEVVQKADIYDGTSILLDAVFVSDGIEHTYAITDKRCPTKATIDVIEDRSPKDGKNTLFWTLTEAYKRSTIEQRYGVRAVASGRFQKIGGPFQSYALTIDEAKIVGIVPAPKAELPPSD